MPEISQSIFIANRLDVSDDDFPDGYEYIQERVTWIVETLIYLFNRTDNRDIKV